MSETLNVDWRQGENHYDGALTGQPASRAFLYIISSIIAALLLLFGWTVAIRPLPEPRLSFVLLLLLSLSDL